MPHYIHKVLILFVILPFQNTHATEEDDKCVSRHEESNFQRIVSIGGDVTEILYSLGCEDRIVAIDTGSLYPKSALQQHANVGYLRTLSAEPILALAPDLVIAIEAVEPGIVLDQLRQAGVNIVIVPDKNSLEGIYQKVRLIGDTLAINTQADSLVESIKSSYEEVINQVAVIEEKPRIAFLLQAGHGTSMVAGKMTSADEILKLSSAINVFKEFDGYKPVNAEAMVKKKPDFVLITERSLSEMGGTKDAVLSKAEIRLAIDNDRDRIIVMDDLLLLGFGPRTPQAIHKLASMIHKDLISM